LNTGNQFEHKDKQAIIGLFERYQINLDNLENKEEFNQYEEYIG